MKKDYFSSVCLLVISIFVAFSIIVLGVGIVKLSSVWKSDYNTKLALAYENQNEHRQLLKESTGNIWTVEARKGLRKMKGILIEKQGGELVFISRGRFIHEFGNIAQTGFGFFIDSANQLGFKYWANPEAKKADFSLRFTPDWLRWYGNDKIRYKDLTFMVQKLAPEDFLNS